MAVGQTDRASQDGVFLSSTDGILYLYTVIQWNLIETSWTLKYRAVDRLGDRGWPLTSVTSGAIEPSKLCANSLLNLRESTLEFIHRNGCAVVLRDECGSRTYING